VVALVGENGSGKTTLVQAAAYRDLEARDEPTDHQ
jgi:ABC-type Mn2+/Zn2+ transport system ATPase subunit